MILFEVCVLGLVIVRVRVRGLVTGAVLVIGMAVGIVPGRILWLISMLIVGGIRRPLGAIRLRSVSFLSADVLSVFSPMSYQQMSMFKCQM